MIVVRSKYQLCTFVLRDLITSSPRGLTLTGDMPGGQLRPFCEQLNAASTSHSSSFTGTQPSEVTQSVTSSVLNSWHSLPNCEMSCSAPVEVSAFTMPSTFGRTD